MTNTSKVLPNINSSNSYYNLAIEQQRLGEDLKAIDSYLLAIFHNPDFHMCHFKVSQLLNKAQKIDLALHHIHTAIKLNNNISKYHEFLGNIYWREGELKKAEFSYLKCIEINEAQSKPYFRLSKIYERKGDLNISLEYLELAINLDNTIALYFYQLGELMLKLGNIEESLKAKERAQILEPLKFSFCKKEIAVRYLLFTGELVIIPAGFRCHTKGVIYKKFKFNQPSLPFNSGFFPPQAIASLLKNPIINLKYPENTLTHNVCIKSEKYLDPVLGLGIKFEKSTYAVIDERVKTKDMKGINKYLDSTYGYYTLDRVHNYVLAHYNWHKFSPDEKSNNIYEPSINIKNINETLNKRIKRMFKLCIAAKHIIFVVGEFQNYNYMMIDNDTLDLNDFSELNDTIKSVFNNNCFVTTIANINSADKLLEMIGLNE